MGQREKDNSFILINFPTKTTNVLQASSIVDPPPFLLLHTG